jgi:murein DD-endopeptidase MepM/ murein hydrolase activator NlpD
LGHRLLSATNPERARAFGHQFSPSLAHGSPRNARKCVRINLTLTLSLHKSAARICRKGRFGNQNPGVAGLFQKNEFGQFNGGAGAALWLASAEQRVAALPAPVNTDWRRRVKYWAEDVNLVPDLGHELFTVQWFRGLATCFALCFTAIKLTPDFAALPAPSGPVATAQTYEEVRSQMITPLALGGDSGRHMAPTAAVTPLLSTPERPMISVNAAISESDSFARALSRAGVSDSDIDSVTRLAGGDVSAHSLNPGTRLNIVLGRRANPNMPRPLDALDFHARLDLSIAVSRVNGELSIKRIPIRVDSTPLRIRGVVSDSVYRAARAAGASPGTIQTYLRVLAQQISLDNIGPGDKFDMIVAHRRAETGDTEVGELLYAGASLVSGRKIDMLKWNKSGQAQWFEASGVGEKRGVLGAPVSGHLTSSFGMRFHPILGYTRMHSGVDFGARYGSPIYAVTDGVVSYAGQHGGHGNYVRLQHSGGLGTGYAHMSRIAAYVGQRVRRGQVIGYVGSSGLSTGPHLHYEVYRGGQTVNPMTVSFIQTAQLAGAELKAFRSRLAELKALGTAAVMAKAEPAQQAKPGKAATRL